MGIVKRMCDLLGKAADLVPYCQILFHLELRSVQLDVLCYSYLILDDLMAVKNL